MSEEKKKWIIVGIVAAYALLVIGVAIWLVNAIPSWLQADGDDQPGQTVGMPWRPGFSAVPKPTLVPNPYDASDFVFADGFMTFLEGETVAGIDVSYFQKEIDWQQVVDFGIDFVIVRLGYRGYETGNLVEDNMARKNLQNAKAAGLQVGAYFYSQAINAQEAAEEAAFVLEILDGFQLDLPVAYDWEYVSEEARTADMDEPTLTACTIAFCDAILAGGYEAMVYFNPAMADHMLDMFALQDKGYPLWLAHFSEEMTFPHKIWLWQYSYTGQVPGVPGNVDLNIMFPQ